MRARRPAEAVTERSGVLIRPLTEPSDFVACAELFAAIWGRHGGPPANELRAHSAAGSYLVGAYDGQELVGGCLGFWGPPPERRLHSHIAAVSPAARGRDLGYALKLHQRAYALERGVELITWTYDPLIARNAHFNLHKLGARAAAYKIDYYGAMPDAINAGDETDRIVVHWDLRSPQPHPEPGAPRPEPVAPRPEPGAPRPEPGAPRLSLAPRALSLSKGS